MITIIEFDCLYPLEEISVSNFKVPDTILHNSKEFNFQAIIKKKGKTHFKLSRNFDDSIVEIDESKIKKIYLEVFEILNRLLTQVRAFYHLKPHFQLISFRTIEKLSVKFEVEEKMIAEYSIKTNHELPEFLDLYYELLNDNPYEDWWDVIMEDDQLPHITLLMDGFYAFSENKYNECIINCCTSLESYIFPKLLEYFKTLTLSKSENVAKNILMNISIATKYEILFGSIDYEYLGNLPELLRELKQITKIRNRIIHSGQIGKRHEAWNALNYSAKLYLASFLKVEDLND